MGAVADDTGASNAGSAYVYDLSSGSAVLIATLNNPTPATSDLFGYSVSVSGNTTVVGARQDGTGAANAGSAYVYDLSSGSPVLTTTLNNPTPASNEFFGHSVSVSGDTVVVGAIGASINVGNAYVYDLSSGSPILIATLNNPTPAQLDQFGNSVSVSGDTVVVGAGMDDTGASDAGSAYVYDLSSGSAVLTATLNNPTPVSDDQFGFSVSVSGGTAVVGALDDDTQNTNQGAAYVYGIPNNPPTATGLTSTSGYIEDDLTVPIDDILVSDADEGEIITAILAIANTATGTLTANDGASYNASTGQWSITDTVAVVNTALANVAFLPAANNDQDTTLVVTIDDGDEDGSGPLTGTITLDVTPVNDRPVVQDEHLVTHPNNSAQVTLSASDQEGAALSFQITGGPANGVISGTAPMLEYTPNPGFVGNDHFYFRVTEDLDNTVSSFEVLVTIDVVAQVPAISFAIPGTSVVESAGQVLIDVNLDSPPSVTTIVPFTLSGTAMEGADYLPTTDIVFAPDSPPLD